MKLVDIALAAVLLVVVFASLAQSADGLERRFIAALEHSRGVSAAERAACDFYSGKVVTLDLKIRNKKITLYRKED
jgi:hypothetical protein